MGGRKSLANSWPKVNELESFVNSKEFRKILHLIEIGEYRSKPVKMVEIPKLNGGVITLGIPTLIDRVIQQAISQALTKYLILNLASIVTTLELEQVHTTY